MLEMRLPPRIVFAATSSSVEIEFTAGAPTTSSTCSAIANLKSEYESRREIRVLDRPSLFSADCISHAAASLQNRATGRKRSSSCRVHIAILTGHLVAPTVRSVDSHFSGVLALRHARATRARREVFS